MCNLRLSPLREIGGPQRIDALWGSVRHHAGLNKVAQNSELLVSLYRFLPIRLRRHRLLNCYKLEKCEIVSKPPKCVSDNMLCSQKPDSILIDGYLLASNPLPQLTQWDFVWFCEPKFQPDRAVCRLMHSWVVIEKKTTISVVNRE